MPREKLRLELVREGATLSGRVLAQPAWMRHPGGAYYGYEIYLYSRGYRQRLEGAVNIQIVSYLRPKLITSLNGARLMIRGTDRSADDAEFKLCCTSSLKATAIHTAIHNAVTTLNINTVDEPLGIGGYVDQ